MTHARQHCCVGLHVDRLCCTGCTPAVAQTILKVTMPPELGVTQPFDKQAVSSQVTL